MCNGSKHTCRMTPLQVNRSYLLAAENTATVDGVITQVWLQVRLVDILRANLVVVHVHHIHLEPVN